MTDNLKVTHHTATSADVPLLASLNKQLLEDELHSLRDKPLDWIERRMRQLLDGEYEATLFELDGQVVAYALYTEACEQPEEIYLRQFFVHRDHRRKGIGRAAVRILKEEVWPREKRLTLEVLVWNEEALSFWKAMGYTDYSLAMEIPPSRRD